MPRPLIRKIRTLAAKVETTIGTPETLAAADCAFNAYDLKVNADIQTDKRDAQGSMDNLSAVVAGYKGSVSFKTDAGWDGTATLPTWATVLLPACGYVESSAVFNPTSEAPDLGNTKTLTIGGFQDGIKKFLAGAMGSFKIMMPSGKQIVLEWTFWGVWQDVVDAAIPASITYPTAKPIRFASSTLQFNTIDLCTENLTFDASNEVIWREDPSTAAGYKSCLITDRHPKVTGNPEENLVADRDAFGNWRSMTEAALTATIDGPSTSTIALSAPKAQIVNVQESDRNGLVVDDTEWDCNKNGANADEDVSLTFTAAV